MAPTKYLGRDFRGEEEHLKFYRLTFAHNIFVTCHIQPLVFSGTGWASRVIGTCNGGYCKHIRALESPKSSEFTIQSGVLIEKVSFLSWHPDICIFNLKSNFMSEDKLVNDTMDNVK